MSTIFQGSDPRRDLDGSIFFLEAALQHEEVGKEAVFEVYCTHEVKALDSNVLAKLLETDCDRDKYFIDNQTVRLDTRDLVCKEGLLLHRNVRIFLRVWFPGGTSSGDSVEGRVIKRGVTTVRQGFISSMMPLPRNQVSHPTFSMTVFQQLTDLVVSNMERREEKRFQLRILLTGQDGVAKVEFSRRLAENLGLDYMETVGRELTGETAAITEGNLGKAVREVGKGTPKVWMIR